MRVSVKARARLQTGGKMGTASILDRNSEFTCLAPSTEASLLRNDKVYTRRDSSGSDNWWVGVEVDKRQLPVHEACAFHGAERHTLDSNGFELLDRPLKDVDVDFRDKDSTVVSQENWYSNFDDRLILSLKRYRP